jgi:hypothetical protein
MSTITTTTDEMVREMVRRKIDDLGWSVTTTTRRANTRAAAGARLIWRTELSAWLHGHRGLTDEKLRRLLLTVGIEAPSTPTPPHRHRRRQRPPTEGCGCC